ncbi:MAG: DUF5302 domain-containing protein [Promicromonosporaceae bacterium]|nr:DUF5302 domain-containing protein [Promicromonosporaceae bacterium]
MTEEKKPSAVTDDAKAKFKAALDAKNERAKKASTGGDVEGGQPSTKGPETMGSGPKMFRRKAGG